MICYVGGMWDVLCEALWRLMRLWIRFCVTRLNVFISGKENRLI